MGNILKRLSKIIYSYHIQITVLFCLLSLFSIWIVMQMQINTEIIDAFPRNNATVNQFKSLMEKYGAINNLIVVIESKNKTIEENTDLIDDLVAKLNKSNLFIYVDYSPLAFKPDFYQDHFTLFLDPSGLEQLKERLSPAGIDQQIMMNRQTLVSPLSTPADYELIKKDPLHLSGLVLDSLKKTYSDQKLDFSQGYYFTKDHSMALIFARPKGISTDMSFIKTLKKELDKIVLSEAGNISSDVKISITGRYIVNEELRHAILHDIVSSFVLSIILIFFLIWLAYRIKLQVLLIIGTTLFTSLIFTLALAYFIFHTINIVTSIVAIIVIGLYVDYSINLFKRFGDELEQKKDIQQVLDITLNKTGPNLILSALTTSLSAFSILITKFQGLFEIGVVCGLGVLICLFCNLVLMTSLLVWIGKKGGSIYALKTMDFRRKWTEEMVGKRKKYIFVALPIMFILISLGIFSVRFDNNIENLGLKNSPAVRLSNLINQKIGRSATPLVILIKGKNSADLMASFDDLEKIIPEWKKRGIISGYNSLNTFLPSASIQEKMIAKLQEIGKSPIIQNNELELIAKKAYGKYKLVYDPVYLHEYFNKIAAVVKNPAPVGLKELESLDDPKLNHFYNKEDQSIATYVYPVGREWTWDSLNVIQSFTQNRYTLIGEPFLLKEIHNTIIRGTVSACVLALLLNVVILYIYFKETRYVVYSMLSLPLGFMMTLGTMGYLDIPFNFINVGTIALVFGFGVDYGIYFMQAYLHEETRDIRNSYRLSGKNIVMCAATTVVGCGSLITIKMRGIASIGPVLSIGAFYCALSVLIILPFFLYLDKKIHK